MGQGNRDAARIVCATRGGEGSEPTIERAIALARERGLGLTFLYIADVEFIRRGAIATLSVASEELRKMGEFIMATLVERAQAQGVEADAAVREGRFRAELLRYVEETRPETVVLGCPQPGTCFLDPGSLSELAWEIDERTGVEVELL